MEEDKEVIIIRFSSCHCSRLFFLCPRSHLSYLTLYLYSSDSIIIIKWNKIYKREYNSRYQSNSEIVGKGWTWTCVYWAFTPFSKAHLYILSPFSHWPVFSPLRISHLPFLKFFLEAFFRIQQGSINFANGFLLVGSRFAIWIYLSPKICYQKYTIPFVPILMIVVFVQDIP